MIDYEQSKRLNVKDVRKLKDLSEKHVKHVKLRNLK